MQLGLVDAGVLLLSVAFAVIIGIRNRGQTDSVEAFLLGNRDLPWWAILGSIVATETSTATVLSVPATAFGATGMKFLQLACGYVLGRTVVVYFLLPLYFNGKLFSAYEVLEQRFGHRLKQFASLLFLVTRNLGDGLRLYLAALVLEVMFGWPFVGSALAIGGVTILYTVFGGMRSVVWNDCVQLIIYMIGGLVTVFVITAKLSGGWEALWEFASATGKLQVFRFYPPSETSGSASLLAWLVSDPYSIWAAVIGGALLTIGTHGTDQMMVQRYLSARSQRDAARAILYSGFVVWFQFALFLFIGVQLACFYASRSDITFERNDYVYAHFVVNFFPKNTGLIGLMLAAILAAAMSTLSSSLNASASALLYDFYLPKCKNSLSNQQSLKLTRRFVMAFGVLQIAIGIVATQFDNTVVSNALTIAGFAAGILLGLFSLGVLTRRVGQAAALVGASFGLIVLLSLQFLLPPLVAACWPGTLFNVAWPWFTLIGSSITFFVGYLASFFVLESAHAAT